MKRVFFQAGLFGAGALGVLALAFAGMAACQPVWLPGDEVWTLGHHLSGAFDVVVRAAAPDVRACDAPFAGVLLRALYLSALPLLAALTLGLALYEIFRVRIACALMARRGGHAVILGEADEILALVRQAGARGRLLLVGRDDDAAARLAQRFWRLPVIAAASARDAGLDRAREVAAMSASDVANLALLQALARGDGAAGPFVQVRLESPAVRLAQGDAGGDRVEFVSLQQLMFRRAAAAGDPGPAFAQGRYPAHIAIIGDGAGPGELAQFLAGFGYGLERAAPRLTIIGVGGAQSLGVERLAGMPDIATLVQARVDIGDPSAMERALAALASEPVPPCAVHCVSAQPGDAQAYATLAARVLGALCATRPPVIAHGQARGHVAAAHSGITFIAPDDLSDALAARDERDRTARAVHESYLAQQGRTQGDRFGKLPGEQPWPDLPLPLRDDNRAAADHLDHMLKAAGLIRRPASAAPFEIDDVLMERLAAMAHARWMAAKRLAGWRYGKSRDDPARISPYLVPYGDLPEAAKEKDRVQIRAIPHILAAIGEEIAQVENIPRTGPAT